jgi:RHS repeat-associated protein
LSPAGRQTGFLPPTVGSDGSYETRSYDPDGNAAAISGPGDRSVSVAYDQAGRVGGWQFDQGAATTAYDPTTGLLSGSTAPGGIGTGISYVGGIPVGSTVSGPVAGAVLVALDEEGRVASESVNGASPMGYTYDPAWLLTSVGDVSLRRDPSSGQVSQASLGVVQTIREYDAQGRPARIATTVGGKPALELRYGYDLRGRVTSVSETRAGAKPVQTTYAYDSVGRLAGVSVGGTRVELDGYDAAGNRVTVKTPSGTLAASYDDRDRLQSWGESRYVFRPDGQLASMTTGAATTTYTFDDFGALQAVTLPDGRAVEYLVDAAGTRIGKKVDGALEAGYLHRPDGRLAAQTDGSGAVVARFGYDDAGRLTLLERGSARYQVVTDHLGSPFLVIDAATGKVAEAITYDAWGNVTGDTNPGFIPIGFAGGLRDPDTGLTLFGAREYDPRTGRWTGPDPIRYAGGDAILYRYVAGDPVNATDPTGLYRPRPSKSGSWEDPRRDPTRFVDPQGTRIIECTGIRCHDLDQKTGLPVPHRPPISGAPGWGKAGGTIVIIIPLGCFIGPVFCHSGEPHERSGDGVAFEFQGAGEFQMVASPDETVVIQARMEPYGPPRS